MTNVLITQAGSEVSGALSNRVLVTQTGVEASTVTPSGVRLTQTGAEVSTVTPSNTRVTQSGAEASTVTPSSTRITQACAEVSVVKPSNLRVNQVGVEVSINRFIPAPTGLSASTSGGSPCGGFGVVGLTWNSVSVATSYNVYRSTTSGSGYSLVGSSPTTNYSDTAVNPANTYYYVATAVVDNGNSAYSNEANTGAAYNPATITPSVHSNALTYFNDGGEYEPGPYRCCYVKGAYSYDPRGYPPYGLTVNGNVNIQDPTNVDGLTAGFYITNGSNFLTRAPGLTANYATQAECEAANAVQSVVFQHPGGPLALFLADEPFWDNVDGTPSPTFTLAGPGPVLTFELSPPDPIIQGSSVVLTWSVANNPSSVSIDQGIGTVSASGSVVVNPTVTTTYTLSAAGVASIPGEQQVTVYVGSPGAVNYVQAQGNCSGTIALSWGASEFASSYRIQQSPTGAESWMTIGSTSGTSITVTPPNAPAAYDYSIQAFDGLNYGEAGVVAGVFAGGVPSAPAGLTATPFSGRVELSALTSTGATGYDVYRGPASGSETLLVIGLGVPVYIDSDVTNGVQYFYTMTATTACGESEQSPEVSARPELGLQVYEMEAGPASSWRSGW